jgi:hypothetical protein
MLLQDILMKYLYITVWAYVFIFIRFFMFSAENKEIGHCPELVYVFAYHIRIPCPCISLSCIIY